jgi:hypothetical protein
MKRMNWIALFITGVIGPSGLLFGQGTAFTYQGQLKDGGSPATGAYDMTFRLFDAETVGNQVGADLPQAGTTVTDGLFTVSLDFGAGMFDGTPRWLEIEVNTVVLSSRQALTSTPYAQTCDLSNNSTNAGYAASAGYSNAPWVTSGSDLYYNGGNIGIGTSTPTAKLEIAGTPGVDGIKFPDGTLQLSATVGAAGYWSPNGTNIYKNNAGFVGIGTSTPAQPLTVRTATNTYGFSHTDGTINLTSYIGGGGNGGYLGTKSNHSLHLYAADSDPLLTVNPNRNIGIGTLLPLSKLDITATGDGAELLRLSTERPWVFKQAYTGSGTALRLQSTSGVKNFEITGLGGTNVATFWANDADPRVGIGTTAPLSRLDIAATGAGAELLRFSTERPWIFRQTLTGPSSGLELYSTSGQKQFQITAVSGTPIATFVADDAAPKLIVNGTTSTKLLQITGADLAERFPTTGGKVEPGTVMEIDPKNPGQLRMARGEYNQRVAGVVSGANDFPAGAILGHLPGNEDAPAIALSGRVWVRCDAGTGAIRPGDLLTTSNTAGHAMKAADRERSHGAVLGKAMTALEQGHTGLVLVLVNLQ